MGTGALRGLRAPLVLSLPTLSESHLGVLHSVTVDKGGQRSAAQQQNGEREQTCVQACVTRELL